AEHVHVGVEFSFLLFEVDSVARDFGGKIHARDVGRRVEIGRPERDLDAARLRALGDGLERLAFGFAGQEVGTSDVAIAASRPNVYAATLHLHFNRVASPLPGLWGRDVAQHVVFVQFFRNLIQSGEEVVGVEDWKAAGARCERVEHFLVGGRALGYLGNDLARLI